MPDRFDVVVVGAGPTGEHALGILLEADKKVALVEREFVGGECSGWACIPSKTLLRPTEVQGEADTVAGVAQPSFDWPKIRDYRNYMTVDWDDSSRVESYEKKGVTVVKEAGRLAGPGRVEAGDRVLEAEHVILATGSSATVPSLEGLEDAGYWTNREAMEIQEVPASVVILGGGPVGTEFAQLFSRLGAEVKLVERADHLVAREEPALSELLEGVLRKEGVELHLGRSAEKVRRDGDERVVTLDDGTELRASELIVVVGRELRTDDLGLDSVAIEPGEKGEIPIDERCRAADGVWAAGDVTGVGLFTHTGKYQARVVVANILGHEAKTDYRALPRMIFTHPEVAAVGMTEEQAREHGIEVDAARIELAESISRPFTYEKLYSDDWGGTLRVIADRARGVLVGAWAVAPLASEWIHQAVLAIRAEVPLDVLRDTIPGFPSYSEGLLMALRELSV
jgi:pyruvate/2-oxoglutarate dehydrogenase complex dihydrolipoamide dehydrogenase (E3) component